MPRLRLLALVLSFVLAVPAVAQDTAGDLDVRRALVRQHRSETGNDVLALEARLALDEPLAFDRTQHAIAITIGTDTFRMTPETPARVRERNGRVVWRRARGAVIAVPNPFRALVLDAASGRIALHIDRSGPFGFTDAGPDDVEVAITVADREFVTRLAFRETRGGRVWRVRPGDAQRPRRIPSDALSQIQDPRELVVRDASTWTALWREHTGEADATPPAVDFARDSVIAVFRAGTGMTLSIDAVSIADDVATVRFTRHLPGAGCVVPQVWLPSAAFARVARIDGEAAFVERVRRHACAFNLKR